ncbi:hypothetical protein A6A27_11935 [Micromonospora sp. CB01531]|nr:hypothetical protein A6A27_11935 [Micromonospora sp. CB01531]
MWWLWEQLDQLDPDIALGGIYANKKGYHNTRAANDANWPGNYSVIHADDRKGPSDKAAAIDLTFRSAQGGDYRTIEKYSDRLYAAGKAEDPRLDGWREFFGQCDNDTHVEGWDFRKDQDTTSDSSHLWHIHCSEVRAYVESMANKECLLSVLKGESLADYLARGGKLAVPVQSAPAPAPKPAALPSYKLGSRVLRKGMTGTDVKNMQTLLVKRGRKVAQDGVFGSHTEAGVKDFQKARWLEGDGIVGPDTLSALVTNLGVRVLREGMTGSDVKELQRLLTRMGYKLVLDGVFGGRTVAAVKAFQKSRRLKADGIAGPKTVEALRK